MRFFHTLLLTSGLAALSSAVAIPTDMGDGVYIASINSTHSDAEQWVRVSDLPSRSDLALARPEAALDKRILGGSSGCSNCNALVHPDCDAATNVMKKYCTTRTFPAHAVTLAVSGQVAWYLCNYSGTAEGCTAADVTDTNTYVTKKCGLYQAGWIHQNSPNRSYGRDVLGSSICSNI